MINKLYLDSIGFAAFVVLLFSQLCMFLKLEPFFTWFYLFAWWSYIILIDSIIFKLKGNSLIRSRGKEILILSGWSVVFWFIFESVNLFLENWYYINLPANVFLRRAGIILAFATVLPGIFETVELIEITNTYRYFSTKRFKCSKFFLGILFSTGVLFACLSMAFPKLFFPLIWGSFTLILEPILYLTGGRSLLKDFENGNPRKVLILLTSGLICGFLWEFWNFWSYSKWVYTLPFLNQAKIFEMPMAGFLGFPPFAIDCYVMYNFVSFFRKDPSWEKTISPSGYPLPRPIRIIFVPAIMVIFSFTIINLMEKYTVDSYESSTKDIPAISAKDYTYLSDKGLSQIRKFVKFCRKPENAEKISKDLNLSVDTIKKWADIAELIGFNGIGTKNFLILQEIGIESIPNLAKTNPEVLYNKFNNIKPLGRMKFWINEANRALIK